MDNPRFVETGKSSFFGDYIYDQVVPQGHFLRQLNQIIDWDRFTRRLIKLYKGGGVVGRPPFDPAVVLKMELIAYLYNLTERQVEVYIQREPASQVLYGISGRSKRTRSFHLVCFSRAPGQTWQAEGV